MAQVPVTPLPWHVDNSHELVLDLDNLFEELKIEVLPPEPAPDDRYIGEQRGIIEDDWDDDIFDECWECGLLLDDGYCHGCGGNR